MLPCRGLIKGIGGLVLNTSKASGRRYYGKKNIPVVSNVKNTRKIREEERREIRETMSEMEKNVQEEFNRTGTDASLESNFANFDDALGGYQRDYKNLDQNLRRQKMFRKHFRDLTEKEVSVLTWAEKEKIRFLHESDPNEWTPEALACVFPVTPEGAEGIIKSSFRAKSLKEIQSHDLNVAERLKRIKSGDIPMNPDLEEKMKMREQIPLNIGAIGPNDEKLLIQSQLPKVIGEFARLVTPVNTTSPSPTDELMALSAVISGDPNPGVGDSYMVKDRRVASEELKQLNINSKHRMTLSEFESRIKQSSNKDSSPSQEIEYLKNLEEKKEVKPTTLSDVGMSEGPTRVLEIEDYLNYHNIPKYKQKFDNGIKENSNSYSPATQYKKPVTVREKTIEDIDHIDIPQELRQPGAVFRRGESYYDENGEFMYRVV